MNLRLFIPLLTVVSVSARTVSSVLSGTIIDWPTGQQGGVRPEFGYTRNTDIVARVTVDARRHFTLTLPTINTVQLSTSAVRARVVSGAFQPQSDLYAGCMCTGVAS